MFFKEKLLNFICKNSTINQNMIYELAKSNVQNRFRDYLIYFITLTFSIGLFYLFNSVDRQFSVMEIGKSLNDSLQIMSSIMMIVSLLISSGLAFLIVYANRFLMRKRKKELGIYITLGMDKRDIANLLSLESVIIGFFSLVVGLVVSIIFSQGLTLLTANLLGTKIVKFALIFSFSAVLKTLVFFISIFYFVNKYNKRELSHYQLIDLLYADRKNETLQTKHKGVSVFNFLLSTAIIILGYAIMLKNTGTMITTLVALAAIIGGTYGLFLTASDLVLKYLKNHRSLYYREINLFIIQQIGSKFKTLNRTLFMISMLVFLSIITMSSGLLTSKSIIQGADQATPYDISMTRVNSDYQPYSDENQDSLVLKSSIPSIEKDLKKGGFEFTNLAESITEIQLYNLQEVKGNLFLLKEDPSYASQIKAKYFDLNTPRTIMKISDFNAIRVQQGLDPITLGENQFLINCQSINQKKMYEYYAKHQNQEIQVNHHSLSLGAKIIYDVAYQTAPLLGDSGTIIVPDEVVTSLSPIMTIFNLNYVNSKQDMTQSFLESYWETGVEDVTLTIKSQIYEELVSINLTLSYISGYVGIVLLMIAGALLALQQLAELDDNQNRFGILKKLGTKRDQMQKALFIQVVIYFIIPLTVALLHSIVFMPTIYIIIEDISLIDFFKNLFSITTIITLIYGSYFMLTYLGSRHILDVRE